YDHIDEQYGKLVVKILRYHDVDSYTVLNSIGEHELIDLFEKPDDEHSTIELINLKKEICNIIDGSISLKVGTKNKIISLVTSTQEIMKKKKLQLAFEAKAIRLYQHQSSSTNNSDSDNENIFLRYRTLLEEAITHLLTKLNKKVHGV
ncbi:unnamed protein product, partial [Adineta steineri]